MTPEEMKAVVRRDIEGWNKGNLPAYMEMYAPNLVYHNPAAPNFTDFDGAKKYFTAIHTNFPDAHITIEDLMAAEGDKVVMRWIFEGTDKGGSPALGTPPTGKHVKVAMVDIYRFEGSKVVEMWQQGDYLGLRKQLME